MKSKKTTYILIALVIGIWGYVGYSLFQPEEEFVIQEVSEYDNTEVEDHKEASTQLDLDYKDPFLDRKILAIREKISRPPTQPSNSYKRPIQPKPIVKKKGEEFINWPNIRYAGTINEYLGLVKFNGKKIFVKKNDIFKDVRFVSFNNDSLKIEYKKKLRSYPKNRVN